MCFTIKKGEEKKLIAEATIVVYKSGKLSWSEFISPIYNNFTYERDKVNYEVELVDMGGSMEFRIDQGYHFDINPRNRYGNVGIFLIPAGATYYEDYNREEGVSSQLTYLGPNTWLNRLYLKYIKGVDLSND